MEKLQPAKPFDGPSKGALDGLSGAAVFPVKVALRGVQVAVVFVGGEQVFLIGVCRVANKEEVTPNTDAVFQPAENVGVGEGSTVMGPSRPPNFHVQVS